MNEAIRPDEWPAYSVRQSFNLYELACLLCGVSPRRLLEAVHDEQSRRVRERMGPAAVVTPAEVLALVEAAPEMLLGDAVGGTLLTLKTAAAATTVLRAISLLEARGLAAAVGMDWPAALSPSFAPPAFTATTAPPKRTATPSVQVHRSGRDSLTPLIQRIRAAVADGGDSAQVWAELERLGRLPDKERPAPLHGTTSGGVQWLDGRAVKVLTRKALGERMRRAAR